MAKRATVARAGQVNSEEEFSDPRLEKLQRVLMYMLHDFSELCESEGLRWMGQYGTALGALRHGGIIPWDDDVDVCMPRADHDRLVELVMADKDGKYTIENAAMCPGYPLATTHFALKGTEFRTDDLASMDFPSSIFIDVFPYDNLPDDEREFSSLTRSAWFYNKLSIAKAVEKPFVQPGPKALFLRAGAAAARTVLNAPLVRRIDLKAKWMGRLAEGGDCETHRLGFPCDTDRFWSVFYWDELFPARMVPFGDMTIPIPNKAEDILERRYGDWRQAPPPEMRCIKYPEVLDFGPYDNL